MGVMTIIFEKDTKEITESDLVHLKESGTPEGKNLEYKGSLNIKDPRYTEKLLKTVCAFANTNGGLLIYGIDAKNGIPTEMNGIKVDKDKKEKLGMTISHIIKDRSEPSIPSVEIEFIEMLESDNVFILIKIPRSWNLPHRVSITNNNKYKHFFIRGGFHNILMDIFELRTAFNLSETLADKIKRFREERISSILSDQTPIPMEKGAKIVLHLIPINAFYPGQQYDIDKIKHKSSMVPINIRSASGFNYTFEGLINKEIPPNEESLSLFYVELYRNGIIESVTSSFFNNDNQTMDSSLHETEIVNSLKEYLNAYKELNIEFPVFVFITLVGVKGYHLEYQKGSYQDSTPKSYVDRTVLATTEIILETYSENIGNALKPAFDAIQNAFGVSGSENYDNDGNWIY